MICNRYGAIIQQTVIQVVHIIAIQVTITALKTDYTLVVLVVLIYKSRRVR